MIFEGLNDEYRGHVETMYPGGVSCLFTKTPDEIWDFFQYLAHDTQEYNNARETFGHPTPDPYMMHATPLVDSQIGGINYEHSHTPCDPVSCDQCDFFDYDDDTCPLRGRPYR